MLVIERATDFDEAATIIREYALSTGVDLEFQGFTHEMESLATYYDPLLLARWDGELAACGALRDLGEGLCEMKRLYVRPRFRGHAIGRAVAERLIAIARERGFRAMRLDTLPSMRDAMHLYESLGFVDIAPYRFNPVEGSRFLELTLR
jgi:ribosomal protein S18 acetylase RimI-like enzyme